MLEPVTRSRPAAQPDPRLGVFETLLVIDGRPVELDAHLARLEASLAELFPACTPPALDLRGGAEAGTWARLLHTTPTGTSNGEWLSSLRITVAPNADGELATETSVREVSRGVVFPEGGVSLRSFAVPGGLGAHKWTDRSLLDEVQSRLSGGSLPLVVDTDAAALEASRANLFAIRDGALFTPPLDGRILPGVTRSRVLAIAAALGLEAHETELAVDELLAADEVLLTGSVRGIERVGALDGTLLAAQGEISSRLSSALRREWSGEQLG